MTDEEERALREQLARLQQEHRDLDAAITALVTSPGSDLFRYSVSRRESSFCATRSVASKISSRPTSLHNDALAGAGLPSLLFARIHGPVGVRDHFGGGGIRKKRRRSHTGPDLHLGPAVCNA